MLPPAASLLPLCRPWTGILYRSAHPQYASTADLLSGVGTKINGGRWTPAKSFPATYLSLDPETALVESLANHRYYGLPLHKALPRQIIAAQADLRVVLDLTDPHVASTLKLDPAKVLAQDWRAAVGAGQLPDSQAIAVALHAAGVEAFIVPSAARPGFSNLVFLPDNLQTTSAFSVLP